jgi:phosphomannomutase
VKVPAELAARARAWIAEDPDPETRAELEHLLAHDHDELARRFAGRLQFGTAGLRGEMAAGPMRMNRVTVRRAAAGLARHLLDTDPDARRRGVVVAFDGRRNSEVFALDSVRVLAGAGLAVHLIERPMPTPVAAFATVHLDAAAGVVVTASHNPPADNGYKVYLPDGSQIVSPHDVAIAACIDAVPGLDAVPLGDVSGRLVRRVADEVLGAYLRRVPGVRRSPATSDAVVAYTAMHGVGADVVDRAFAAAGLPPVHHVEAQRHPDGRFPTVAFPNPEEPGAMDLLLARAAEVGADVALANDPDADRLAAAVPTAGGGWRALKGDEVGWLLADHLLRRGEGDDRLVVTTLVSSSLLAEIAAAHGVHHLETPTGFKWIAQAMRDNPGLRFVMGYEQALGYLVADLPRDKDGITAAVVFAELVAAIRAGGGTVEGRLDELAARFGRHVLAERSVRLDPAAGARAVAAIEAAPPVALGGRAVRHVVTPVPGLVRLLLEGGARVQVRPSGTEPKVKLYGEAVGADPGPLLDELADLLTAAAG